ncbi:MAG: DUF3800 domain-containing protein [Candidatus Bipolaricaulota bacterium]|nr:DUF3800 domain-containing protein [Candidatus Bipolaricaulota bacterium]
MAYFLFVDESGNDGNAPYQVLAGVSVEDAVLWDLVRSLQAEETKHFGCRYTAGDRELKAKKILKRKTFRLAAQLPPFPAGRRRDLALKAFTFGQTATREELTALAQTKLAYVEKALEIAADAECRAFASVVRQGSPTPVPGALRKDYNYLLERFFYYLEDMDLQARGVIVCDELEKSRSYILIDQFHSYFMRTVKGKARSQQIIPAPFFVHSDLTSGIQLADLVAYIISWGLRFDRKMDEPVRHELASFAGQVKQLEYESLPRSMQGKRAGIFSFKYIEDLRSRTERCGP